MTFPLRKAVESRYSVRSYEERSLDNELKAQLISFFEQAENPFGPKVRMQFIEKNLSEHGEKLGTYGIIKGADCYIGVTVQKADFDLEALGYVFEQLVLYATSIGLGSCWLGGTFNRSAFTAAMDIREGELFPILSPIGYPAEKKSLTEKIMRSAVKAGVRLPWDKLFYNNSFSQPVTEGKAGEYNFAFEMLRLAPSAVNKQPWRLLIHGDTVHFYKTRGAAEKLGIDMQRIDMGIAMAHFALAMKEQGTEGRFEKLNTLPEAPENLQYIISWKKA